MKRKTVSENTPEDLEPSAALSLSQLPYPHFPLPIVRSTAKKFHVFPTLVYADDDGVVQTAVLDKKSLLIGSSSDNDVVLMHLNECHVEIEISKKALSLNDINSGKVYVNGQKVGRTKLQPGDSIRIGQYLFCVALKVRSQTEPASLWEPYPRKDKALGFGQSSILSEQGLELFARIKDIRAFSCDVMAIFDKDPDDFESLLEFTGLALLDLFSAARAFVVLFEEDGNNPVLTVKKYQKGYEPQESDAQVDPDTDSQIADVTRVEINETLLRRTVKEKAIFRLEHQNEDGQATNPIEGLSVPIMHEKRVLGLLYFDRPTKDPIKEIEEDLFDLVARLLAHPFSHFVG
jgi:hypothetical protein